MTKSSDESWVVVITQPEDQPGSVPSYPRPNILLIMCDQLSATVLKSYGGPVPTPNIERIVDRGVTFENATCPFPVCSPSRASLVTGLYPHAHGIVHNVNKRDYAAAGMSVATEEGLHADDVTTERLLHEAGYQTHHYGKWHLLDDDLPYYPDMFGEHSAYAEMMAETFAEVRSRPRSSWMDWYGWALPVTVGEEVRQAAGLLSDVPLAEFIVKMGRLELPVSQCFDAMVADRVVERLKNLGPEPFMVTCSFNAPHDPNVVPAEYYDLVDPDEIVLPANGASVEGRFSDDLSRRVAIGLGEQGVREFLRIYYAMVRLIDDQVGRVLDALEATSRAEDTIVVFTADHGDMVGAHGMVWKSTRAFYDEVVHVPLMISYPRCIAPRRSRMATGTIDLMPTLLNLVGLPVPERAQGNSVKPYVTGESSDDTAPGYSFCERLAPDPTHRRDPRTLRPIGQMVRSADWKYIRYHDGDEFLYHLAADPGETTNLADSSGEYADGMQDLRSELEAWRDQTQ